MNNEKLTRKELIDRDDLINTKKDLEQYKKERSDFREMGGHIQLRLVNSNLALYAKNEKLKEGIKKVREKWEKPQEGKPAGQIIDEIRIDLAEIEGKPAEVKEERGTWIRRHIYRSRP